MSVARLVRSGDVERGHLSSPPVCVGLGQNRQVVFQGEEGAQLAVSAGVLTRVPGYGGPGDVCGRNISDGADPGSVSLRLLNCRDDGAAVTAENPSRFPFVHFS